MLEKINTLATKEDDDQFIADARKVSGFGQYVDSVQSLDLALALLREQERAALANTARIAESELLLLQVYTGTFYSILCTLTLYICSV